MRLSGKPEKLFSKMPLKLKVVAALAGMVVANGLTTSEAVASADGPTGSAVHLSRIDESPESVGRQFLCQNDLDLKPEEAAVLSFWAKSPQSVSMRVSMKVSQPPWASVGVPQQVDLTPEWQRYDVTLETNGAELGKTRLSFNFGKDQSGDIFIADVHLHNESSSDNLITNGRFEDGLNKWYSEGQKPDLFQVKVLTLADANAR